MQKRVTSQDVAELAGVSRTTVSFVLNEVEGMRISPETRQRVLKAARKLNYHPDASARRLVRGRTQVLGFIKRQSPALSLADAFLPEFLRGLHDVARKKDYYILYEPYDFNGASGDRYVQMLQERHADGVVISGPRFDDQDIFQLHRDGFPVVLHGRVPGSGIPTIDIDNVNSARLAVEHLIELGHQRIGLITNAPQIYTSAADRKTGYELALQEAGLPKENDLIQTGNFSPESGSVAMERLLAVDPRPTAVFVASDVVAIGAMQAVKRAGLHIPMDVALVGFDDVIWARYLDPPLSTIRLPAHGLGWCAGEALIQMLESSPEAIDSPILLETELVIRESCGSDLTGIDDR